MLTYELALATDQCEGYLACMCTRKTRSNHRRTCISALYEAVLGHTLAHMVSGLALARTQSTKAGNKPVTNWMHCDADKSNARQGWVRLC